MKMLLIDFLSIRYFGFVFLCFCCCVPYGNKSSLGLPRAILNPEYKQWFPLEAVWSKEISHDLNARMGVVTLAGKQVGLAFLAYSNNWVTSLHVLGSRSPNSHGFEVYRFGDGSTSEIEPPFFTDFNSDIAFFREKQNSEIRSFKEPNSPDDFKVTNGDVLSRSGFKELCTSGNLFLLAPPYLDAKILIAAQGMQVNTFENLAQNTTKNSKFYHNINTIPGMSGGPIINQDGIFCGVHRGFDKATNLNFASNILDFLNDSIKKTFNP